MHCRDLLAVELGIIILVEQEQFHDASGKARDTTELPGIDRIDDVHDLGGRNAHRLSSHTRIGEIAGMAP